MIQSIAGAVAVIRKIGQGQDRLQKVARERRDKIKGSQCVPWMRRSRRHRPAAVERLTMRLAVDVGRCRCSH